MRAFAWIGNGQADLAPIRVYVDARGCIPSPGSGDGGDTIRRRQEAGGGVGWRLAEATIWRRARKNAVSGCIPSRFVAFVTGGVRLRAGAPLHIGFVWQFHFGFVWHFHVGFVCQLMIRGRICTLLCFLVSGTTPVRAAHLSDLMMTCGSTGGVA